MTIPRIEHVYGTRDSENIVLKCTGCNEYYNYSVRTYKGDFGCNISEFESFLQWAKWDAARHECFLAGRMGYLPPDFFEGVERGVEALKEGRTTPWDEDNPLTYHVDFPQVETREEDPWGGVGYIVEPEEDELDRILREAVNPLMQGNDPDGTSYDDDDDWIDLGLDDEDEFGILENDEESPYVVLLEDRLPDPSEFGSIAAEGSVLSPDGITITGRITVRHPTLREIPRLRSFPPIEFDYADLVRRILDEEMVKAGIYYYDVRGNLRDEKGRCLACLRHGVHW